MREREKDREKEQGSVGGKEGGREGGREREPQGRSRAEVSGLEIKGNH